MNHKQSTISHRSAFTLIELLVVIAIIALLAALLLPALKSARSTAKRSACLSNLHQVALATTMYAGDFNSYPPGVAGAATTDYGYNAYSIEAGYGYPTGPVGSGLLVSGRYLANGLVLYCPGRTQGERLSATWAGGGGTSPWSAFNKPGCSWVETSYFLASSNISTNLGLSYGPWHRFGTTDPSKPLAFDYPVMSTDPATGFAVWAPWGMTRHHHGPGYNFVCFDGSGVFIKDPTDYLETTYNSYINPWQYADSNWIYYIHTKLFGWTDHTKR